MKEEYDFSHGEQGKFYSPDAIFCFPIYLDPDVGNYINELAVKKNQDVQFLVNELLRSKITKN